MHLKDYQERARKTDQSRKDGGDGDPRMPQRHDVVPLLGLVGEVGGLLGEYKKRLRDGETHRSFPDEVAEELGDILWYVANVADKFGLDLETIAEDNLKKVSDRWLRPAEQRHLYDDALPVCEQLPRKFEYRFEERRVKGVSKMVMVDGVRGADTGAALTDNAYEDDGYRFHDVMHLAFASLLGWSPVLRKLLRNEKLIKHRTPAEVDEAEDGGRGQVVEEAIVAAAYVYASEHGFLKGIEVVDWQLLRHITKMTRKLEVGDRSTWAWNEALVRGFAVWRALRDRNGGTVVGDLERGTIEFRP